MTPVEIADDVRDKFGDEQGVQIKDSSIVRWINHGQRHLVLENEKLLQKVSLASTVSEQQEYAFPIDLAILRSVRFKNIHIKGLSLLEFDEYIDGWSDPNLTGGLGVPQTYTIFASKIILFPIPKDSEADSLKIYYNRNPVDIVDLAGTIDLPITYHNALREYVLQQAYEKDEDFEGYREKAARVNSDIATLKNREDWVSHERYPRITTLPEDW